mmetsp:Transcript_75497/g.149263  ORF Transcript_75497/g.149263 Transcript_75497/m.149263 type:complete len:84 (+) Transcript_75497:220-471(+)
MPFCPGHYSVTKSASARIGSADHTVKKQPTMPCGPLVNELKEALIHDMTTSLHSPPLLTPCCFVATLWHTACQWKTSQHTDMT